MVEGTTHLTVLDMLDVLEGEIVLLRKQNESLSAALSNADHQLASSSAEPRTARRAGKRTPKRKAAKRRKTTGSKSKKMAPAAGPGTPPKEDRVLGKRQALGKSLLQLRKPLIAHPAAAAEPAEDKPDVFHG